MDTFIATEVDAVKKAIESEDWNAFEEALRAMVAQATAYNDLYQKPFLRWRIPAEPPPDLDMAARR